MPTYAVFLKSDLVRDKPVYIYDMAAPEPWHGMEFATHDHVVMPDPVAPPAPVQPVRITKLAFRNRFTPTEKTAIEFAASDNPAASQQARFMAAALRANLADQRDATHIDLTRADTIAGVQALEAAGLIAAGRATVILGTAATDQEVWNG